MLKHATAAAIAAAAFAIVSQPTLATTESAQQPPNAERCAQIMKTLTGDGAGNAGLGRMVRTGNAWSYQGGDIGRVQDQLRAAEATLRAKPSDAAASRDVERLKAEQNRLAGLINRFTDQLSEMKCPGATAPVRDLPSTGSGAGAAPTAAVPPGDAKALLPILPSDAAAMTALYKRLNEAANTFWTTGELKSTAFTLTLKANLDAAGTVALMEKRNEWGEYQKCSATAKTYGGEISWHADAATNRDAFTARVIGCGSGAGLFAKFTGPASSSGAGKMLAGNLNLGLQENASGFIFFCSTTKLWNPETRTLLGNSISSCGTK